MGGALSKFWAWWQYLDKDGSYPEPCSPSSSSSSSSFLSCDELEFEFNPEAAETHESSSHVPTNYKVFLSFSGHDTRLTFTSHLYDALDRAGIKTFMDEEELKQGEEIAPNLLKAIVESRISIPIFSTNYASSKWCLDELVKIMESRDKMRQTVLPIFYHVNPRDVRKQTDGFGQQFDKLAKNFDSEKVGSWKEALKQAGNLKGWDLETIDNSLYVFRHLRMSGCSSDLLKSVKKSLGQRIPDWWTFTGNEIPDGFTPLKVSYCPSNKVFKLDCEEEVAATGSVEHEKYNVVVLCFVFTLLKDLPPVAGFEISFKNRTQVELENWAKISFMINPVPVTVVFRTLPSGAISGHREYEELGQVMEVSEAGMRVLYNGMDHSNLEDDYIADGDDDDN